jgi:hypothetical protein
MKKWRFFIGIILFSCRMSFSQTTTIYGALSIYTPCNNGVNPNGCGNSPNYCNEASFYTFLPGTNSAACGTTQYNYNCGNNSGTSPYGSGSKDGYHYSMYSSVLIPSGCTATVLAEYGESMNYAALNSGGQDCANAGMDAGGTDILGISTGYTSSPLAANWLGAIPSLPTTNIGTCAAGTSGLNGATLNSSGGSGCYVSGGSGNADVTCTLSGQTNVSVTMWAASNRGDEILTYTITGVGATCSNIGVIVLPIQLIAFMAYKTVDNDIIINWATATEVNNSYFMVEYSLDAKTFFPYKEIKGAGSSMATKNYSCPFMVDIGKETPYFRLKQVDFNGNFKYSQVIMLGTSYGALKNKNLNLTAYYSADNDGIVTKFHLDYSQQVNVSLYDVTGTKIQDTNSQLYSQGDNEVLLNAPDKAGIYLLVYQAEDGLTIHKKIMILK